MVKNDPRINGNLFSNYGVGLLASWAVSGGAPEFSYHKAKGSVSFDVYSADPTLRTITLPVTFRGKDDDTVAAQKAAFEAPMYAGKVSLFLPDGYVYDAMLSGIGDDVTIMDGYHSTSYTFTGSRFGQWQTIHGNGTAEFIALGTRSADCTITATATGKTCSVAGIHFSGVKKGDVLTVDGITKRILVNGWPDIAKCDVVSWPKLSPGRNLIEASGDFSVRYRPTY